MHFFARFFIYSSLAPHEGKYESLSEVTIYILSFNKVECCKQSYSRNINSGIITSYTQSLFLFDFSNIALLIFYLNPLSSIRTVIRREFITSSRRLSSFVRLSIFYPLSMYWSISIFYWKYQASRSIQKSDSPICSVSSRASMTFCKKINSKLSEYWKLFHSSSFTVTLFNLLWNTSIHILSWGESRKKEATLLMVTFMFLNSFHQYYYFGFCQILWIFGIPSMPRFSTCSLLP